MSDPASARVVRSMAARARRLSSPDLFLAELELSADMQQRHAHESPVIFYSLVLGFAGALSQVQRGRE